MNRLIFATIRVFNCLPCSLFDKCFHRKGFSASFDRACAGTVQLASKFHEPSVICHVVFFEIPFFWRRRIGGAFRNMVGSVFDVSQRRDWIPSCQLFCLVAERHCTFHIFLDVLVCGALCMFHIFSIRRFPCGRASFSHSCFLIWVWFALTGEQSRSAMSQHNFCFARSIRWPPIRFDESFNFCYHSGFNRLPCFCS